MRIVFEVTGRSEAEINERSGRVALEFFGADPLPSVEIGEARPTSKTAEGMPIYWTAEVEAYS